MINKIKKLSRELKTDNWTQNDNFDQIRNNRQRKKVMDLLEDLKSYNLDTTNQVSDAINEVSDNLTDIYLKDLLIWLNEDEKSDSYIDEVIAQEYSFQSLEELLRMGQVEENRQLLESSNL